MHTTEVREHTFENLTPKVDIQSPLLISKTPGIVTFLKPARGPDGQYYMSAYADEWLVHIAGQQLDVSKDSLRGTNGYVGGGREIEHYTLVAFHKDKPVFIVPSSNVDGICPTNNAPSILGRDLLNISEFWDNGGLRQYGSFERGEVQDSRTRELVNSS